ncbi:hypothetical protein A0U40_08510 [[Bacillus] sp. KCTC 13219]|nr:hypothetical protein A0U40_08510 [[Bacillus] sp. KCTC 13219]
MHINEVTRKYILLGIVVLILGGLSVANVLASKQNTKFETEDFIYQQALQMYRSESYTEAKLLISDLLLEHADSEMINYLAGLIDASNGEYTSAAIYMQKALDINPHKVEEPMFMLQFGEVLFLSERFDDAKIVLNRCKESDWQPDDYPDYQAQVQDMLTQIENM